jgi:hypothetical protein
MRSARRRRRLHFSRKMLLKSAVAALFVQVMAWLAVAVAVGTSSALREQYPALTSAFGPFNARARAARAEQILMAGKGEPAARAEARSMTQAALLRDATVVAAWRNFVIADFTSRPLDVTTRLFGLIERMSRRDLATQLWLIEERVRQDDIAGALQHYDIALRTAPQASEWLLPVLVSATANDGIIGPLAALLRTDPPWRQSFLFTLAQAPPSGRNALRLVQSLAAARLPTRPDIMATLIDKVAAARDFDSARRLYSLARPGNAGGLVRNGGFSGAAPFSAFEWALVSQGDLSADQINMDGAGDGNVLEVRAARGAAGIVAQQMLVLAPGRYRISERSGALSEARPADLYWRIVCVNRANSVVAEIPIVRARSAGTAAPAWQVPAADCPAQWLALAVRPGGAAADAGAWVDAVAISRAQ